ncbi:hypothetical protein [Nostoc sp.]
MLAKSVETDNWWSWPDACIDAVGIEDHHIFQQKKDNSIKVILKPEW